MRRSPTKRSVWMTRISNCFNDRMTIVQFEDVARLPLPGDNVAIASRRLEAGTQIGLDGSRFELDCTVMEGHRFATEPISRGERLLSWGLPFGVATTDITTGSYVCNEGMLQALEVRRLDFQLPGVFNFEDRIEPYELDIERFRPGEQVAQLVSESGFRGYDRGPRGVGTRNYILVVGTTSRAASFARTLAQRLKDAAAACANVDGVVAVAHTEGGGADHPNNQELLLRALAGFCIHPNVGAVLAVDYRSAAITNDLLKSYLRRQGYAIEEIPHRFLTIDSGFEAKMAEGERQIRDWLGQVDGAKRSDQPLSKLKIALQCGGSDAFSGVSGNPLAAWVAREIIRHGGTANLAETDELIGAEPYVLANVRDLETARRFLSVIERFKERAARHGVSAEGNPSGGNKFRGLYNIVLKSIGAARKRDPDIRLDHVIDYGQLMESPGYYFMDSPGNDLESIAGQVASGSNVIFFVTGNGSITNFPFVPTIKIVTTTSRYEQLREDMDVNAGAYQDGTPMDELGAQTRDLTLEVASGRATLGERAGHSQVSIWRNWELDSDEHFESLQRVAPPSGGQPAPIRPEKGPQVKFKAIRTESGYAVDQVGLVLPTSLCSGQIARMTAERLNADGLGKQQGISRFVSLVHTEGCGVGMGGEDSFRRTMVGYLIHPLVKVGLLMEHGCEITHNDYFRERLSSAGIEEDRFGWSSVQMDGGIDRVMEATRGWFTTKLESVRDPQFEEVGLESLSLGILSAGIPSPEVAVSFARLSQWVVEAGGTVVTPTVGGLMASGDFVCPLFGSKPETPGPTLAHGQSIETNGFHIMECPTDHWVETLTGMGATGIQILLAHVSEHPMQSHPMVPLLQVTAQSSVNELYGDDVDLFLEDDTPKAGEDGWPRELLNLIVEVASRRYSPRLMNRGNTDFQLTRGLLGVSL